MKRILLLLAAGTALAVTLAAQYYPAPPRPPLCHDEVICTGVYGCRWVTVCN